MLAWEGPDESGVFRAFDELALYVIWQVDTGRFVVGYFPSPGPECPWENPVATIDHAKSSAERCASHVRDFLGHLQRH